MTDKGADEAAWNLEQSIIHLLHRASQVAEDRFAKSVAGGALTPRQFAVLAAVARDPNMSQTGLVRVTGVDRSTLADVVRRLVNNGLLIRRRTREDARAYAIRLSPQAITLMQNASVTVAETERVLLESLDRHDQARLISMLQKIIDGAAISDGAAGLGDTLGNSFEERAS